MNAEQQSKFVQLAAEIVSAYVTNSKIPPGELGQLIENVHIALVKAPANSAEKDQNPLVPAVPIKKSVTPDYIISLEDGRKFKSLKRHLNRSYGMTPGEYRAKWGLPHDYPMVAPNYAQSRSELAKQMGLGRKAGEAPVKSRRSRKRSAKG
jgi:predicted transcriptional regulator